jgi:uncharacterized protein YdeI (YjbR/CyaY-like superfamily)
MPKMDIEIYYPKSRTDWRNWLQKSHQLRQSVWLVFYKKSTKIASISWSEAVDEALCFGWIDSTKKQLILKSTFNILVKESLTVFGLR